MADKTYWMKLRLMPATGIMLAGSWVAPAYAFFPPVTNPGTGGGGVSVSPVPPVSQPQVTVPPTIPIPVTPPPPFIPVVPQTVPPTVPPVVPPVVPPTVPPVTPTEDCCCTSPPPVTPSETPEPATMLSGLIGLGVVAGAAWKRRKAEKRAE